jgi:hypothetical protein
MRHHLLVVAASSVLAGLVACGDSSGDDDGDGEREGCSDDQIEVYQPGADTPDCEALPAECNGTADCFEQTCAAAMYGYCPGANVACSDDGKGHAIVTCS